VAIFIVCFRVPTPLGSPGFFCRISGTGKVLENDFGPGKFLKFKLKVLEIAGMWTQ